jgi:hypothetical protein
MNQIDNLHLYQFIFAKKEMSCSCGFSAIMPTSDSSEAIRAHDLHKRGE